MVTPKLGLLQRLSKCLPKPLLTIVYNTIIQPHFDYCITLWGNCSKTNLSLIQRLQNRAARIVSQNYDYNVSGLSIVTELKWMNVEDRLKYFTSILMYKIMNRDTTVTLHDMFQLVQNYHTYNTRGAESGLLVVPKCNIECFKKSIAYQGAVIWNTMENILKSSNNIQQFKANYKRM